MVQARRQEFPEGCSSTRTASCTPRGARCYCGRSPGVFGAKSCNLATSRQFILTFEKSCFSKLIFKDFHQILDYISQSLNKTLTLIVLICFQGGVRTNPSNPPWLRVCDYWNHFKCKLDS